jgi:carbamate kinase
MTDASRARPLVVAFGGNALLPDPFHPEEQEARAAELAHALALFDLEHHGLVLVHGNGPQVGMILLRVETCRDQLPREPLDVLVAETQGSVGFLLTRALHNAFVSGGTSIDVSAVLTQVVVDADDPGFRAPTKPIGPFYAEEVAGGLSRERGWAMVRVPSKGWRRVVPSPRPREVVELAAIREAARPGRIVVAGGGGGVPVRRDERGHLHGVEAVLDKDRTSALLARSLDAEQFVVLTGVPHVATDFGTPSQRRIEEVDVDRARALLARGEFPAGSMGPKVEAAADYVASCGRPALITDIANLAAALQGNEGTWIVC